MKEDSFLVHCIHGLIKLAELLAQWIWETAEIDVCSSFEIEEDNRQTQRNHIIPNTVFQLNMFFKSHIFGVHKILKFISFY